MYGLVKEIKVKAGEPIEIDLPIDGAPVPDIKWTKNGEKMTPENSNW